MPHLRPTWDRSRPSPSPLREPSVFGLLSTRGTRLPTSLKSFGYFSVTYAGAVSPAAFEVRSPNVARRPDPEWETTSPSTVISEAGPARPTLSRRPRPASLARSRQPGASRPTLPPSRCRPSSARHRPAGYRTAWQRTALRNQQSEPRREASDLPIHSQMAPQLISVTLGDLRYQHLGCQSLGKARHHTQAPGRRAHIARRRCNRRAWQRPRPYAARR